MRRLTLLVVICICLAILAGVAFLLWRETEYTVCKRDMWIVFILRDNVSKEPVAGAEIVITDLGPGPAVGPKPDTRMIRLITDDAGKADWMRRDSMVEDVIKPFHKTSTVMLFASQCSFDVWPSDHVPIKRASLAGLPHEDKGHFDDRRFGKCQRVEFTLHLAKVGR